VSKNQEINKLIIEGKLLQKQAIELKDEAKRLWR